MTRRSELTTEALGRLASAGHLDAELELRRRRDAGDEAAELELFRIEAAELEELER